MTRPWSSCLGVALCVMVLAACSGPGPEPTPSPPAPDVSTREFEQRLAEHLSRFGTEMSRWGATASAPKTSRTIGCASAPGGGPTWGVVPRASITVSAGNKAETWVNALQDWMERNAFHDITDNWPAPRSEVGLVVTARSKDGTRVRIEHPHNSSQFLIAMTGPCTWPPHRAGGPSSRRLPTLPPPSGPKRAGSDSVCLEPERYVYNPAAPPYAGPGPHPMILFTSAGRDVEYDEFSLPDSVRPMDSSDDSALEKVQLVVCVSVDPTRDSGRTATCYYTRDPRSSGTPHTFNVFESVYHVVVREARSGKPVKEFTVPGTRGDIDSCPYELNDNTLRLARGIDETALERHLLPLAGSPQ